MTTANIEQLFKEIGIKTLQINQDRILKHVQLTHRLLFPSPPTTEKGVKAQATLSPDRTGGVQV